MPIEMPSLDQLIAKYNIPESDVPDIFECLLLLIIDKHDAIKKIESLPIQSQRLMVELMMYSLIESKRAEQKEIALRKALGKFGE